MIFGYVNIETNNKTIVGEIVKMTIKEKVNKKDDFIQTISKLGVIAVLTDEEAKKITNTSIKELFENWINHVEYDYDITLNHTEKIEDDLYYLSYCV